MVSAGPGLAAQDGIAVVNMEEYHPVMNPYGARPEVRTAAGKFAGAPATPPLSPAVQSMLAAQTPSDAPSMKTPLTNSTAKASGSEASSAYLDSSDEDAAHAQDARTPVSFDGFDTLGDTTPGKELAPSPVCMTLNPMYQPGTEPRGAEEASEAVSPAEEGATAQPRAPANTPLAAQAAPAAPAAWSEVKQALRSKASSRAPSAPQSPHKEGEAGAATKPGSPVMEPEAQSDADGDDESLELEARDALERELVRRAEGADEAVEGPAPSEDAAPATPVIGEECAPGEVEGPAWNVRGALVAYAIVVLPVLLAIVLASSPSLAAPFVRIHGLVLRALAAVGLAPVADAPSAPVLTPLEALLAAHPWMADAVDAVRPYVPASVAGACWWAAEGAVVHGPHAAAWAAQTAVDAADWAYAYAHAAAVLVGLSAAASASAPAAAVSTSVPSWAALHPSAAVWAVTIGAAVLASVWWSLSGSTAADPAPIADDASAESAAPEQEQSGGQEVEEVATPRGALTPATPEFGTPLARPGLNFEAELGYGAARPKSAGRRKSSVHQDSVTPMRVSKRLHTRQTEAMVLRDL